MNKLVVLFTRWLETSSQKQKLTAALLVFSVLSTIGLFVFQGASGSSADPLESTPFYFVGVFVKLVVVLLLIVASSVIFRRWSQPRAGGKKTRQVQLLETVRLAPKQALHLVSIGDQHLLVGATDQGITLISQVELSLDMEATGSVKAQPTGDFASLLQGFGLPSADLNTK